MKIILIVKNKIMEKKVLLLRTCKKDFARLINKKLTERYLEVKKYWETRVLEKN